MKDRRTARRYDLSLPVIVRALIDKEGASRTGKTRDVSTRGVYFTTDNHLGAGAELNLTIILPAEVTGDSEVFIKATGTVIRVDKRSVNDDQLVGVAIVFEMHEIVHNEAAIALRYARDESKQIPMSSCSCSTASIRSATTS